MKLRHCTHLILCLWAAFPTINAQNSIQKFEWGNVPSADRSMTHYAADPTADAVVLGAITKLKIELKNDKPLMTVSVFRRIKLFTEAALLSQKSIELPFDFTQTPFKLSKLEAQLVDEDNNQQGADVVESGQMNNRRLIFNNLRLQHTLELSYEITTDNLESITNWVFQEVYPVHYAELWTTIDAPFEHIFSLQNEKNIRTRQDPRSGAKIFSASNLPANKAPTDAFSLTCGDQTTGVRLQVKTMTLASKEKKPVMSSWSELANRVLKSEGIGQQYLKKSNFDALWKAMQPSVNAAKTEDAKLKAAYNFINENVKWNGEWNTSAQAGLNTVFDSKWANSGELNLMLIACLNEAGFKAHPMLVSTRQHGKTNESTPFLSQFNHLLCYVERTTGVPMLLDAGSVYRPMGLPRVESLNGDGWIVNPKGQQWQSMSSKITARQTLSAFSVNNEGDMKGRFVKTSKDQEAIADRDEQARRRSIKALEKQYLGIRIDSVTNSNPDASLPFFKHNIYCFLSQMSTIDSGKMTIKPLWRTGFEINPLAAMPLNSALDFPYLIQDLHVFALQIPPGSSIVKLPNTDIFELPDKSAGLSLTVSQNADLVQLSMVVKINKLHFEANEYANLKAFFDKIRTTQTEAIVIKLGK